MPFLLILEVEKLSMGFLGANVHSGGLPSFLREVMVCCLGMCEVVARLQSSSGVGLVDNASFPYKMNSSMALVLIFRRRLKSANKRPNPPPSPHPPKK